MEDSLVQANIKANDSLVQGFGNLLPGT